MAPPRIHAEFTAISLLGSFNPRIFQPLWFAQNGLLPAEEAEQAEMQMIDRDFCRLHFGWAELVVVQERLQLRTTPETVADAQVRDLLVGLLKLLPHTPIERGSIHHRSDIPIATEEEWHAVGDALAPKELWDGVLEQPGMFDSGGDVVEAAEVIETLWSAAERRASEIREQLLARFTNRRRLRTSVASRSSPTRRRGFSRVSQASRRASARGSS